MKKRYSLVLLLIAALIFCGCHREKEDPAPCMTAGNTVYTEEELCRQVENTFNTVAWYSGDDRVRDIPITQEIEYTLYEIPGKTPYSFLDPPKVRVTIENIPHPRSTESETYYYDFQINVTENGLGSDFCASGASPYSSIDSTGEQGERLIGHYSMNLPAVTKPVIEVMSREWTDAAENALRKYMDWNEFYGRSKTNLPVGNYHVYIKGFTAADMNTLVYFEHEDGRVYEGYYYFVHGVSGERIADLNHVALALAYDSEDFLRSFERVKETAALTMEYAITKIPGWKNPDPSFVTPCCAVEETEEHRIFFRFPQLDETEAGAQAVNQVIGDFVVAAVQELCWAETAVTSQTEAPVWDVDFIGQQLVVEYNIRRCDEDYLSVTFEGQFNSAGAAHPLNYFASLTINRKTGKRVTLPQLYRVDDDFVRQVQEAFADQVPSRLFEMGCIPSEISEQTEKVLGAYSIERKGLQQADGNGGYYSFLTEKGLGISIPVAHAIGDHMEFWIAYEDLEAR